MGGDTKFRYRGTMVQQVGYMGGGSKLRYRGYSGLDGEFRYST